MAKKFTNTRCIYCLRFFKKLTSDHVLPQSWYPDTTPENIKKMQVPACTECNQKFSKVEGELLQRFGLCVDPKEPKSLGIADRALRSLKASCARNEKDRVCREKHLEKVMQQTIPSNKIRKEAVLPNFRPWPGTTPNEQIGVLVSENSLKIFGEKLVRGISYAIDKRYIEPGHKVEIFFVHDENAREIMDLIKRFGQECHCGQGIRIGVVFASALCPSDDPQNGLFAIEIWGKFRMYASVMPSAC